MNVPAVAETEWEKDCRRWRGRVLVGMNRHWCPDWDFLPIDETTSEIDGCTCTFEGES